MARTYWATVFKVKGKVERVEDICYSRVDAMLSHRFLLQVGQEFSCPYKVKLGP